MKKLILLIGCLFLLSIGLYSQSTYRVTFGLNFSTFDFEGSNGSKTSILANAYVGCLLSRNISKNINFNNEMLIGSKGFRYENQVSSYSSDVKIRTFNLDWAPSVEFKSNKNLSLGIGIYGSLKFSEGKSFDSGDWEFKNNEKLIDGFDLGLNPYLRLYFQKVFLQLGLQYGILALADIDAGFSQFNAGRNVNISLGMGVLIGPENDKD